LHLSFTFVILFNKEELTTCCLKLKYTEHVSALLPESLLVSGGGNGGKNEKHKNNKRTEDIH
jgi:hypothetical protein